MQARGFRLNEVGGGALVGVGAILVWLASLWGHFAEASGAFALAFIGASLLAQESRSLRFLGSATSTATVGYFLVTSYLAASLLLGIVLLLITLLTGFGVYSAVLALVTKGAGSGRAPS